MIREFVDRETERALLEEEWRKGGGRLIILYGRRRIGKTRLVTEFIRGKEGILHFAEDTAPQIQIRRLQEEMARFFADTLLGSLELATWDQLFTYLAQKPLPERRYLVIDEFTYLIKNDPAILSALQKAWDTALAESNWCILLSGSMLGLMTDTALSYTSPLYGRRTRDMLLGPLRFADARKLLPSFSFQDALKAHLTIGGIPEYLLKAADYPGYAAFVEREFFNRYGYFYREPSFLLSQEFRELKTYQAILNAVAVGNTAPGTIAQFCGMDARHLYPYLEAMTRLGIIEKELPLLGSRRQGVYRIRDAVFDFWYNFVFARRQAIEMENHPADAVDLNPYFGKRFEAFVRSEFARTFLPGYTVGRWWYRGEEIDLVAVRERDGSIIFGECKWGNLTERKARGLLTRLVQKAEHVRHEQCRSERFCLVAGGVEGKDRLRAEGFLVYDLADIEAACTGGHLLSG
ncbi:ATP-binding protein [Methanoculleus sp. FWC-SCC1]|uniref:ATP-binding protein n=1 Tax=Methanoculleus frigidifontis TaxID=2584085 RepID=A0ABT8M883_9EURY|nr:ATP-binding protein [Methanoculleus sp. FWC-SCC1]MDN7024150.1 ATP-binding protein [Methanoculleus sp. FWC-SCC1]